MRRSLTVGRVVVVVVLVAVIAYFVYDSNRRGDRDGAQRTS